MKRNYIAYSLWSDQPIYNIGIIKNIQQAKSIYPDWQVIVYYDNTVPPQTITDIKNEGAIIVDMTDTIYGMFWRFYAADLTDCEYVIFRDSDSRLSRREKLAVDEWINSNNDIHIMRDHPHHSAADNNVFYILGGMWGIKGRLVNMQDMIRVFASKGILNYGSDQYFLNEIYARFKNSATIHDEFFDKKPFPIKREGWNFIGEKINEHDVPFNNDRLAIRGLYKNKTLNNLLIAKFKTLFNFIARKNH